MLSKKIAITLALLGCIHSSASAGVTTSPSVKYRVTPVKKLNGRKVSKDILIQKVQLEAAAGLNTESIRAINLGLSRVVQEFRSNAEECHIGAQGHPWSYESKIEKIVLTKKYISFVFARKTFCGGTPDFEKDSIVFSKKTGQFISAPNLFKEVFPGEVLENRIYPNEHLINLNEDLTETLIDENRIGMADHDEGCEFYLKTTSYRVWMDGERMVFFPEFNQASSDCQKEYFIHTQDRNN